MNENIRNIKEAEDFGLGFNCMSRLYMREYDQNILDDMLLVCEQYLPYFSARTVCCSIRDLLEEGYFYHTEHKIPDEQKARYDKLLKLLTKQGITLELARKDAGAGYRRKQIITQYGYNAYFMRCYTGKNMFQSEEEFLEWIYDNKLDDKAEVKDREGDRLPLAESDADLFYRVCFNMIDYSYGRHTYMPSTCKNFVVKNMSLIDDKTLEKLANYIGELLEKYPGNSGYDFEKVDEKTWINFQLELRDEMIVREFCVRVQKVYKQSERFTELLQEIADVTTHYSLEDWRKAWCAYQGVERFFYALSNRSKWKKIRMEEMKTFCGQIQDCMEKQWEIEEGWKYDKVGDGIYIKKRSVETVYSTIDK